MFLKYFFLSILYLLSAHAFAQDSLVVRDKSPLTVNKGKLRTAIITQSAFYVGGMSYLQFIWYKDHDRVPFHFYDDSKGYLQIDKMGHTYGAYLESYISYKWLRNSGLSKKKSLLYGGTMGIILQTPIEIFDGMYEGWGFSWSDMAANTAGSLLLIGQEILFDEQLVRYKFGFKRSEYAKLSNGYLGNNSLESLFLDYNGHTYWLSTNLNNLVWKDRIPSWINIAVGYSANGMYGEFKNKTSYKGVPIPPTDRYRQFFLSPDIDWTKIPTNSAFLKVLFQALNFVKLPAPALEINGKGKIKGHLIYY
jgi:uncharacterized protein YfiM (DUF2279 family)